MAVILVAVLAIAAIAIMNWDTSRLKGPRNAWWWLVLTLAALALAAPLVASLFHRWTRRESRLDARNPGSFGASLLGQSPMMLAIATVVTVTLYILPLNEHGWWQTWGHHLALLAGILVALAVGLAVAFFQRDLTAANRINPRAYGDLQSLFYDLDGRLECYCPMPAQNTAGQPPSRAGDDSSTRSRKSWGWVSRRYRRAVRAESSAPGTSPTWEAACHAACSVARKHRDAVAQELGLGESRVPSSGARWVLGTGYIDVWNRLHAADEALFLVKPDVEVAGSGLYDEMRLKDSNINNSVDYIDKLRWAVGVFGANRYLSSPPAAPQIAAKEQSPQAKAQARVVLREVRHVINEYRDARREGLVRTRNNLMWTGTVTGMVGFLLLGLAVVRGATDSTVVAATAFYLVGATVGLFNQMRGGWNDTGATEEDYGLTQARLLYTPLLSGLAAVGGVLVTTMLYATLSGPIVTTPANPITSAAAQQAGEVAPPPSRVNLTIPRMSDIFDLEQDRFGLVLAAIFGLTPGLLVDRLKGEAERYKADLQSSNAQANR